MPTARLFLQITLRIATVSLVSLGLLLGTERMFPNNSGIIYFFVDAPSQLGRYQYLLDPTSLTIYNASNILNTTNGLSSSPNGERIAFLFENDVLSEVRIFDLTQNQIHTIFSKTKATPLTSTIYPVFSWSPTGRYLSFKNDDRWFKYDFLTGEISELVPESNMRDFFRDQLPSWSPDETRIAFPSTLPGTNSWRGYVAHVDGSIIRLILESDECNFFDPQWSPTRDLVVIDSRCGEISSILLVDMNSGAVRPLTSQITDSSDPSWSPDGSRLIFHSTDATLKSDSYIVDVDGTNLRRLVDELYGVWSPDGERILFSSSEGNLYTIDVDGSNLQWLTFDKERLIAYGWSR